MMKFYKILFTTSMIVGTTITMSSNNWLSMWMGLEINLLSIIPLMSSQKNAYESEAALKYFITQALASTIFMFSILMTLSNLNIIQSEVMLKINPLILNSAILMKMGAAPFHFWLPEVIQGLSWMNSFIMLTWQKIAPMTILMNSIKPMTMMFMVIIASMLVSGFMGINQTSLRKIMAYSSINHIGWMMGSMISNQTIWIIYLIIYTMILLVLVMTFNKLNLYQMSSLINAMSQSKQMKLLFLMNFLSLGGLPPFIGFLPKWLTINFMMKEMLTMLTLLMIISTLLTLFFYMRITFSAIIMTTSEMTTKIVKPKNLYLIITLNFLTISSLILSTMILNFI
uniref:NADH dehydrogenase subunit 2 n=1 Tax=Anthrenus museorum TaxID=1553085 RepID=UPI00202794C6|nr:NADH dehydrogenase subunit 2 [Anthrenus museorum]UQJ73822.1 NADH dehydrogenase subunit 2 [Anthrenus museorum]